MANTAWFTANSMANELINERCPGCGALIAMVGLRHRCSGRILQTAKAEQVVTQTVTPTSAKSGLTTTYQYRTPEDRRAYMAEYMRGYRARKKEKVAS